FAVLIEPADGIDALGHLRHQVDGEGTASRIIVGAEVAARLVHKPVDGWFGLDGLGIDANVLPRLDLRAQVAHSPAVGRHAPGGDEFIAVSPRADAGMGQDFVEAFHASYCMKHPSPKREQGTHLLARRARIETVIYPAPRLCFKA